MSLILPQRGRLRQAGGITVTNTDSQFGGSDAEPSFNFTGVSLGTAASDRIIVVVCHMIDATTTSGTNTFTSVTVGSDSLTEAVQIESDNGNQPVAVGIYYKAIATGTTATITVGFDIPGTTIDHAHGIGVYAIYGAASSTPESTASNSATASVDLSCSLTNSVGAAMIAGSVYYDTAEIDSGWSVNVTEDYDDITTSGCQSGASSIATAINQSITATANLTSGTANTHAVVAASWI